MTVLLSRPHAAAAERFAAAVAVAAERFAAAVSDPRSPAYRHFLTPAEYRSRF